MPRLACRHAVPAVLVVCASLLAPFAGADAEQYVTGTAGSVVARAAVHEDVAPPSVRYAVGSPAMEEARRVAEQHWGKPACNGQVDIAWAQLDAETNATASWRNPTDAWNNAGENFDCRIELNATSDYDFAKLCTVMTHEVGHLSGQPHADAPGQLMSPIYSDPLPACDRLAPGEVAEPVAEEPAVAVPAVRSTAKRSVTTKRLRAGGTRKARTRKSRPCTRRFRATRKGAKRSRCAKGVKRAKRAVRWTRSRRR